ncbi:MAG TPA: anthranilate synthase component I [Syntrophales bacterium]|nr:anthranilate synthase component I [Syntrophales bacterium]
MSKSVDRAFFYFPKPVRTNMDMPDFETFRKMAARGNLVPLCREILADLETPVSALKKLASRENVFLLESVEGGEKWGRYSFLGTDPRLVFRVRGGEVRIDENGSSSIRPHGGDPLALLREILAPYRPVPVEGLPRFYGGAVGFLGYGMVRFFEKVSLGADDDAMDDAVFLLTDTMAIFDNVKHTIKVVATVHVTGDRDLRSLYEEGIGKIEALIETLERPCRSDESSRGKGRGGGLPSFRSSMDREAFGDMVRKAKERIVEGDIIQAVLSRKIEGACDVDPVSLYRALRFINPSPYLFFLKLGGVHLIGSSPEILVRLEEGVVDLKPIAGTRRRGGSEQEDRRLADELLRDEKERAEHVMLVDLGRNDLGRIARIGTVQVTGYMVVEKYSHVMHLVSHVQSELEEGKDAFDVLKAVFPAGTLSGAPKVMAMKIIEELEPSPRGPYGGAVGYIGYSGNMDFCITIRTILLAGGLLTVQTGAGIVADSDPDREFDETENKAKALLEAVRMVSAGLQIHREGEGRQ